MKFTPMATLTSNDMSKYLALPIDVISYDDGYYAKKACSRFKPDGVVLRTLMGFTTSPMSTSSNLLGGGDIPGVEFKTSKTDAMRYLFGLHADQQLRRLVTKSSDEVTGNLKLQQFFAATMVLLFPQPGAYRVRGAIMMPVDAFKSSPTFKDQVKDTLCGLFTFSALKGYNEGEPIYEDYEIFVEKLIVMEQPLGSLFKVLYTSPAEEQDKLLHQRKAFLDWGAGTLDVLTIDFIGGKPQRIDAMCGSAEAGIQILFDYIRNAVFGPAKLNPNPMELERAVMAGRYKLNVHHSLWPASATPEGYIDLIPYITKGIEEMWRAALQLFDSTIGIKAETIDTIFITGGPSGWMQPYVIEHFGEHRVFKVLENPVIDQKLPYKHLMLSENLHLNNAIGGYLYAKTIK